MTWFSSTAWSVMADLWVALLSLVLEVISRSRAPSSCKQSRRDQDVRNDNKLQLRRVRSFYIIVCTNWMNLFNTIRDRVSTSDVNKANSVKAKARQYKAKAKARGLQGQGQPIQGQGQGQGQRSSRPRPRPHTSKDKIKVVNLQTTT